MTQKYSMVFPGQGSQSVGMLSALAETESVIQQTFEEASDVLDVDLWTMSQSGPEARINQTENTQPLMLAAGVAVWRLWTSQTDQMPELLAGHSLGEYTALVAASTLAFSDAVSLVRDRAVFMQDAVPDGEGAMAAILGLADELVTEVCVTAAEGDVLEAVNFNSPGQVVIAGAAAAIDRALIVAKDRGAKRALKLAVSVPSHCRLMLPAADRLIDELSNISLHAPTIPVLHNVNVEATNDVDEIRSLLGQQLHKPVRWVETVKKIAAQDIPYLLEAGPGKILTGLTKRIDKSITSLPIMDPGSLEVALEVIHAE